jgi:beta-lactam-binding protein with PASTA domain
VTSQSARPPAAAGGGSWLERDWLFAVALATFVGTSVWFGGAIRDFFAPASTSLSVPTLVGQTVSDAVASAERSKLRAVVVERAASDSYPKDVVIRQDPEPGTDVRAGRQISLVVSTGLQIFSMPDLRYESLREVNLDLAHDKLQLGKVRTVQNTEVQANRVVAQDPVPMTAVRVGTVVNIDLSKGGPPNFKVPNFTGMSVDDARDLAERSHVRFGQLVWTPFGPGGPARGVVVRQKPEAGSAIDPSQDVSLQISAGPGVSGYILRQVHAVATVPIPQDGSDRAQRVRVAVHDETGTWNVYDAFAQPKQKLDFNLTVVGTSELDVYIDNELISSTKLGYEPGDEPHAPNGQGDASQKGSSP